MQKVLQSQKVYSIVVTYNGAETIIKCISSLINSDIKNHEILIFDNNSCDNTVALIQKNFPDLKVKVSKENLGYGNANNRGFIIALNECADYIFLLDQDAWVKPTTINNLIIESLKHPSFGVFAPLQLRVDGEFDFQFAKYYDNSYPIDENIRKCKFVNSAAWLISKECIKKVGGFSPAFQHFGVENDYSRRVKYNEMKIGIVTSASYVHNREKRVQRELDHKNQVHQVYVNQLATLVDINRSIVVQYLIQFYKIFKYIFFPDKGNEHISKIAFAIGSLKAQFQFLKILKYRNRSKKPMAYLEAIRE